MTPRQQIEAAAVAAGVRADTETHDSLSDQNGGCGCAATAARAAVSHALDALLAAMPEVPHPSTASSEKCAEFAGIVWQVSFEHPDWLNADIGAEAYRRLILSTFSPSQEARDE